MADRNYLIARISVFVSYARKDISKRITLINTLFDRSLDEITDIFVDENLNPGVKVDETIESQLNRSRIILLLLTPNFTSSNYCMNVELPLALRRAREGKCKLCAFILEEGNYDSILQESECLVVPKTGLLLTQIDDAKYQIETARIDLKYVVYQEYEKEHEKIEIREDGAFYGSCRLVESHWESEQKLESDRPATIRGIVAAAAISITFSLSIYFSSPFFQIHSFWPLWLFYLSVTTCTRILIPLTVNNVNWLQEDSDTGYKVFAGIFSVIFNGILFSLLAYVQTRFFDQWHLFVHISLLSISAIVFFINLRMRGQPQRLQIYLDLHYAEKRPENGWIIDKLESRYIEEMQAHKENIYTHEKTYPEPIFESTNDTLAQKTDKDLDKNQLESPIESTEGLDDSQIEVFSDSRPHVLVVHHHDESTIVEKLMQVFIEEGLEDAVKFEPTDSLARFSTIGDFSHVIPILTKSFLGSDIEKKLAELATGDTIMLPVLWEEFEVKKSLFYTFSFLPKGSIPVKNWPIEKQALRNIADNIITTTGLVHQYEYNVEQEIYRRRNEWLDSKKKSDSYSDYEELIHSSSAVALQNEINETYGTTAFDFHVSELIRWMRISATTGFFCGLILFIVYEGAITNHIQIWPYFLPIALIGYLQHNLINAYYNLPEIGFILIRDRPRILIESTKTLVLLVPLAPLIIILLMALYNQLAVNHSANFFLYVEVGFYSWMILGAIFYLGSRRKRPKLKLNRAGSQIDDRLVEANFNTIQVNSPYEDASIINSGDVGNITNSGPLMALGTNSSMKISVPALFRLLIEVAIFGLIGWKIFELFLAILDSDELVYQAFFVSFYLEAFIYCIYVFLVHEMLLKKRYKNGYGVRASIASLFRYRMLLIHRLASFLIVCLFIMAIVFFVLGQSMSLPIFTQLLCYFLVPLAIGFHDVAEYKYEKNKD